MTSDQIAELRKLNEQRTPGPWEANSRYPAEGGGGVARYVEGPDRVICQTPKVPHNVEFIAALANSLPELLDLAERGLAAEGLRRICEVNDAFHWRLVDLFDKDARGVSPLHFIEAEIMKLQAAKEPYLLLKALNDTKAELAAVTAEVARLKQHLENYIEGTRRLKEQLAGRAACP